MDHPALGRILKQIEEHKGELTKPENSMQSLIDSTMANAPDKPVENVEDFLTEGELDDREEYLKEIEAEPELPLPKGQFEGMLRQRGEQGGQGEDPFEESIKQANLPVPPEVEEYLDSEKEEYSFHSIYDLRDFLQKHRPDFEEWAYPAIDSVLAAVKSITSGCKCKHEQRKRMVEDYYKNFIEQNQHTSLITKIKELLKTKNLKFYWTPPSSDEEALFLEV